jgi:tRNA(fMet)-specific endonuclease VapC
MILLDTDHLSILKYPANPRYASLTRRLEVSLDQEIGTTIINVEEQWRGWLSVIARERQVCRQVKAYGELVALLDFLTRWTVLGFDEEASTRFEQFRRDGVRIGSMDLKIACIVLTYGALLLSANLQDFQKVPGVRVENWLD